MQQNKKPVTKKHLGLPAQNSNINQQVERTEESAWSWFALMTCYDADGARDEKCPVLRTRSPLS